MRQYALKVFSNLHLLGVSACYQTNALLFPQDPNGSEEDGTAADQSYSVSPAGNFVLKFTKNMPKATKARRRIKSKATQLQLFPTQSAASTVMNNATPQFIPLPGTSMQLPVIVGPPVYIPEQRPNTITTQGTSVRDVTEPTDSIITNNDKKAKAKQNTRKHLTARSGGLTSGAVGGDLDSSTASHEYSATSASVNNGQEYLQTTSMSNAVKGRRSTKKNIAVTSNDASVEKRCFSDPSVVAEEQASIKSEGRNAFDTINKAMEGLQGVADKCLDVSEDLQKQVNTEVNSMLDSHTDVMNLNDTDDLVEFLAGGDLFQGPGLLSSTDVIDAQATTSSYADGRQAVGGNAEITDDDVVVAAPSAKLIELPSSEVNATNKQKLERKRSTIERKTNAITQQGQRKVNTLESDFHRKCLLDKNSVPAHMSTGGNKNSTVQVRSSFTSRGPIKVTMLQQTKDKNLLERKTPEIRQIVQVQHDDAYKSRHKTLQLWNHSLWANATKLKKPLPAHQNRKDTDFSTINFDHIKADTSRSQKSPVDLTKRRLRGVAFAQVDGINDSSDSDKNSVDSRSDEQENMERSIEDNSVVENLSDEEVNNNNVSVPDSSPRSLSTQAPSIRGDATAYSSNTGYLSDFDNSSTDDSSKWPSFNPAGSEKTYTSNGNEATSSTFDAAGDSRGNSLVCAADVLPPEATLQKTDASSSSPTQGVSLYEEVVSTSNVIIGTIEAISEAACNTRAIIIPDEEEVCSTIQKGQSTGNSSPANEAHTNGNSQGQSVNLTEQLLREFLLSSDSDSLPQSTPEDEQEEFVKSSSPSNISVITISSGDSDDQDARSRPEENGVSPMNVSPKINEEVNSVSDENILPDLPEVDAEPLIRAPTPAESCSSDSCSTVYLAEDEYYANTDSFTEYQPEGYRFWSSGDTDSSTSGTTRDDNRESTEATTQQEIGNSFSTPNGVTSEAMKECRDAIDKCDQLLSAIDGSHLDMSTISVESSGSMNSTTDLLGGQSYVKDSLDDSEDLLADDRFNVLPIQNSVRSATKASVNLDDLVNDKNFEVFQRGITTASTPNRDDDISEDPTTATTTEPSTATTIEPITATTIEPITATTTEPSTATTPDIHTAKDKTQVGSSSLSKDVTTTAATRPSESNKRTFEETLQEGDVFLNSPNKLQRVNKSSNISQVKGYSKYRMTHRSPVPDSHVKSDVARPAAEEIIVDMDPSSHGNKPVAHEDSRISLVARRSNLIPPSTVSGAKATKINQAEVSSRTSSQSSQPHTQSREQSISDNSVMQTAIAATQINMGTSTNLLVIAQPVPAQPFASFTQNRHQKAPRRILPKPANEGQPSQHGLNESEKSLDVCTESDKSAATDRSLSKRRNEEVASGSEGEREEDKNKKRHKSNSKSCFEEWLEHRLKRGDRDDEDDNDSGPSDKKRTNGGKTTDASANVHSVANGTSAGNSSGSSMKGNQDEESREPAVNSASNDLEAEVVEPVPVQRSMSFVNEQLSSSLGPVNNPFRSSGWVKTRCGMQQPADPVHFPEFEDNTASSYSATEPSSSVTAAGPVHFPEFDDNTASSYSATEPSFSVKAAGPMWSVVSQESSDEEEFDIEEDKFDDSNDYSVSDVEQGTIIFLSHIN